MTSNGICPAILQHLYRKMAMVRTCTLQHGVSFAMQQVQIDVKLV